MKRGQWILAAALLLAVAAIPALMLGQAAPQPQPPPKAAPPARVPGVFGGLRLGDTVALEDAGNSFTIVRAGRAMPAVPGWKVSAIGPDYIALQDVQRINILHIPVYSVKAVRFNNIDFSDPRQ